MFPLTITVIRSSDKRNLFHNFNNFSGGPEWSRLFFLYCEIPLPYRNFRWFRKRFSRSISAIRARVSSVKKDSANFSSK